MTSALRHYLAVSLLVSVTWCGSRDGEGYHSYHNRRRTKLIQEQYHSHQLRQQQQQNKHKQPQRSLYTLQSPGGMLTPHHYHRHMIPLSVVRPPTVSGASLERLLASSIGDFRYLTPLVRRYPHPASSHFYHRHFPVPTRFQLSNSSPLDSSRDLSMMNIHKNVPSSIHQRRPNVILKDEPPVDMTTSNPEPASVSSTIPAFLDPANFKLQDMDLSELQATVDWIDSHVKVKDNDPSAYTGSRVLVLLLREQCFRLQSSGDPDIEVFCQRFNNRFRSMLF